jgi:hypothetical protein
MNYWWMNTDPTWWNIFEKMSVGDEEDWDARTEKGRLKAYSNRIVSGDVGLCYQGHGTDAIVAELVVVAPIDPSKKGAEEILERSDKLLRVLLNRREYSIDLRI